MSSKGGFDAASKAAVAELNTLWAKPRRSRTILLSALAGVVFIILLSLILSGRAAVLVLDQPSQHFVYPFTIQNLMHIVFFVGLGDLFVRWRIATREKNFLQVHYLPEDDQSVLVTQDLGPIKLPARRELRFRRRRGRTKRIDPDQLRFRWDRQDQYLQGARRKCAGGQTRVARAIAHFAGPGRNVTHARGKCHSVGLTVPVRFTITIPIAFARTRKDSVETASQTDSPTTSSDAGGHPPRISQTPAR